MRQSTRQNRRKVPRPLDATRLEELALAYVARFATTRSKLAGYLARKLRERGWDGEDEAPVQALCERFVAAGYVDDAAYAAFLTDRIAGALAAQGVAPPEMREAHISPPNSRRRASLSARRAGKLVLLGFNAEASHQIVDMRECHILRPELFGLVAPLRGLLGALMGQRGSGGVRMTLCDQGVDLLLEKVENGYAYFNNPWGEQDRMSVEEFRRNLTNANLPPG